MAVPEYLFALPRVVGFTYFVVSHTTLVRESFLLIEGGNAVVVCLFA